MTWWTWVIVGALLLGAELSFINAQFYLVFAGAAAIAVGLLSLWRPGFPDWMQWGLFGVLAVASALTFRRGLVGRLRPASAGRTGPIGDGFTLPSDLDRGGSCQAEVRGAYWTVTNGADRPIAAGTRVTITAVQGLSLIVKPAD